MHPIVSLEIKYLEKVFFNPGNFLNKSAKYLEIFNFKFLPIKKFDFN